MEHEKIDLTINTETVRQILTGFIRSEITRAGFSRAVVNLSGGLDSSLSCYLAAEALGAENVLALRLPYKSSTPDSLEHAQMVIEALGVQSITIPISDMADALTPLGDLYKTQIRQLASAIGIPSAIIDKPPTADLWMGQTDEGELGFT